MTIMEQKKASSFFSIETKKIRPFSKKTHTKKRFVSFDLNLLNYVETCKVVDVSMFSFDQKK